jgi:OOP family OmpA-OmpF porin
MRTLIIALSLLLLGWLGGGTWFWTCKVRGLCGGELSAAVPALRKPAPLVIRYEGAPFLEVGDNFRFLRNDTSGIMPPAVKTAIDSLAAFLLAHPETELELTGAFADPEANPSRLVNTGMGRAAWLAQHLASLGVPPGRIIRLYEVGSDSSLFAGTDSLFGGLGIRILDKPLAGPAPADSSPEAPAAPAVSFEAQSFYFGFNDSRLSLDEPLREYISRSIQYLRSEPGRKLLLTGHTDNKGGEAYNQQLGLDRANTLRRYFEEFGLDVGQIITRSRGMKEPVADNASEEGRSRNRRVEVQIQ